MPKSGSKTSSNDLGMAKHTNGHCEGVCMTLICTKNRLIIATQRTASTYSLQLHGASHHCVSEPWNPWSEHYGQSLTESPVCVKTLIKDLPSTPDELREAWPDIWHLRRRDRVGQILSLAVARVRDQWNTHDASIRDQWLEHDITLTESDCEAARLSIDDQLSQQDLWPCDHIIYTEDLVGAVDPDSDAWLIAPHSRVASTPSVDLGGARSVIRNLTQCEQWCEVA